MIEKFIETSDNSNKVELSVDEFKDLLHLSPRYSPKKYCFKFTIKNQKRYCQIPPTV